MWLNAKKIKNDNGAIMVMAIFVALFLVAIVYHVAAVGQASVEQQLMQDGADSVAFSAATAKARGMNIIALINLIMAATLAVLVAIRMLQAILTVAIVIVGVACIFSGAACGAMAPIAKVLNKVTQAANDIESAVKNILTGLETASTAVNKTVPVLAQAEAIYISRRPHFGKSELGFAWPLVEELPTKKGDFETLCAKAGENVVIACTFLLPGNLPDIAKDTVGSLAGEMASGFSSFFCGGSDSPPSKETTNNVAYPLNNHPECDDSKARPNPYSGQCNSNLCNTCSSYGCASCLSKLSSNKFKKALWQRKKDIWVDITYPNGTFAKHIEHSGSPESVWLTKDPCDTAGSCGSGFICANEKQESADASYPEDSVKVTRTTYLALHSCVVEETITMDVQGEPLEADQWPKPRELNEEELPEGLRVRGYILGGSNAAQRISKVAIGTRSTKGTGGKEETTKTFSGRINFAAADFSSPNMDLWHMNWSARLIRFRFPENEETSGGCSGVFSSECQSVGSKISKIDKSIKSLILH